GSGGCAALGGEGLDVEGEFADGVLDLVEIGAEARPGVLHRVEQVVLEREVAARAGVERSADGGGRVVASAEMGGEVAGFGTNDGAGDGFGFGHDGSAVRPGGAV